MIILLNDNSILLSVLRCIGNDCTSHRETVLLICYFLFIFRNSRFINHFRAFISKMDDSKVIIPANIQRILIGDSYPDRRLRFDLLPVLNDFNIKEAGKSHSIAVNADFL